MVWGQALLADCSGTPFLHPSYAYWFSTSRAERHFSPRYARWALFAVSCKKLESRSGYLSAFRFGQAYEVPGGLLRMGPRSISRSLSFDLLLLLFCSFIPNNLGPCYFVVRLFAGSSKSFGSDEADNSYTSSHKRVEMSSIEPPAECYAPCRMYGLTGLFVVYTDYVWFLHLQVKRSLRSKRPVKLPVYAILRMLSG